MRKTSNKSKLSLILILLLTLGALFTLNADPIVSEDFEGGNFDDWHVVNGEVVNQWYVGAAGANNGSNGAFISADGDTASYVNTETSIVHFYKDITIPNDAVALNLSFYWRCGGESSYDYGRVSWVDTSVLPEAGTLLSTDVSVGDQYINLNADSFVQENIELPILDTDTEKRIVFTWKNDGSLGAMPSLSIDDIVINYQSENDPPFATTLIAPAQNAEDVFKSGVLQWERANAATEYFLYFGTDGDGTTAPTSIENGTTMNNDTSYVFTNLDWETTYYWQVVPSNTHGNASDCPIWSFTTMEDPAIYPPATEDFTTYLPENWSEAQGILANPTEFTSDNSYAWTTDGFGNEGTTGAARIEIWSTSRKDWLFSPYIDLGDGTSSFQLEFDMALTYWNSTAADNLGEDDRFALLIKAEDDATWSEANIVEEWDETSVISPTGDHKTYDLSSYSGLIQVAFYGESTVSNQDVNVYIDNFSILEQTAEPQFLIGADSFDFGVVAVGTPTSIVSTIANSGGSDLNISSVDVNAPFTVDFPATVAAGESQNVVFTYTPTDTALATSDVVFHSNNVYGDVTVSLSGSAYAPLDGDVIANAYEFDFDGTTYVDSGSTVEYHNDYDLPYGDNNDVVYKVTLTDDYVMDISLHGSDFDTKLAVYEDHSDVPGWIPGPDNYVAYNDDSAARYYTPATIPPVERKNETRILQSRILDLPLQAGSYFIIVDGYGTNTGNYLLTVNGFQTSLVSVSGTVTDASSNEPLEGVDVEFGSYSATTDTAGVYVVNSVIPRNYIFEASKDDYYDFVSPDSVTVPQTDFVYDIQMSGYQYAVVTGQVTNSETDAPIVGANVRFGGTANQTTTDDQGNYRFESLLQGSYAVTATMDQYHDYTSPADVAVNADSVNYNFQMIPHHYGVISGVVTNEDDNSPIEGAKVFIDGTLYETNAAGEYESEDLLYGTYSIYCMARDFDTNIPDADITVDAETISHNFAMHPNPDDGDVPTAATPVYGELDGEIHSIFDADDEDWFVFYAGADVELTMYTERDEYSSIDPKFWFYGPHEMDGSDVDPTTSIASDDDSHGSVQPELIVTTPEDGFYFLRVAYYSNGPSRERANYGDYKLFIQGEVSFYLPPENLEAEVQGFNVELTWDAPEEVGRETINKTRNSRETTREVTGYKVYRNNGLVATVGADELTYTDEVVPAGTHDYYVTAVHNGDTESPESNEVTVVIAPMNPPYGLDLETDLDTVFLEWNFSREANLTRSSGRRYAMSASREVTGFKIYRNDTLAVEIADPEARSYADAGLAAGTYEYYVTAVYYGEFESLPSNIEEIDCAGDPGSSVDPNAIPAFTELKGNYPNPFNPETTINYSLNRNDNVKIVIYNAKGQLVKTLVNEQKDAGSHSVRWFGKDNNDRQVSSGIYFYRMQTSTYSNINKMILMK
jgi:hypothetical protein